MNGFTQLCIIVLITAFALFLLYEKVVWPYFITIEGAKIDAMTDNDGTLTHNKKWLGNLKLDDVSSSDTTSSDTDNDDQTKVISANELA